MKGSTLQTMSVQLQRIVDHVEEVLKTAPCDKYSTTDRWGILRYRKLDLNKRIPYSVTSALKAHDLATRSPLTALANPVQVFCPDNLKGTHAETSLDLVVCLRIKLGKLIETYEDLVRWYLSVS
jgi:hypothetical protein